MVWSRASVAESREGGHLVVIGDGDPNLSGRFFDGDPDQVLRIRTNLSMVFQQFNLFPHLTVLSNVTLAPIWVRKKKKPEAAVSTIFHAN